MIIEGLTALRIFFYIPISYAAFEIFIEFFDALRLADDYPKNMIMTSVPVTSFTAHITHLSKKGHGVARDPAGKTIFVRGAWPGDACELKPVLRPVKNRHYGYARIVKILSPSPDRVVPPCQHLGTKEGQCGGCPWMIAAYTAQLKQKSRRVRFVFEKLGLELKTGVIKPIQPSPKTLGFRNRAQFKTDGKVIGYVSEGTNTIAPIENCVILNGTMQTHLARLKAELPNGAWEPGEGHAWHFIDLDDETDLSKITIDSRRPFKQGNTLQNAVMKRWLAERLADHSGKEPVLELFCGSGNFTEVIARVGFRKVLAVEVDGRQVETLRAKNLANVTVINLDLSSNDAWTVLHNSLPEAEILVLDPPRAGLKRKNVLLDRFKALKWIYYISCDVTHFAHDAKYFEKRGFQVKEIQPVDLFPHTPHVETLAVFQRQAPQPRPKR